MAEGIYESITDERFYIDYLIDDEETTKKYYEIQKSNISILRSWISMSKIETWVSRKTDVSTIIPKIGNRFYSKCIFHPAVDLPVCIDENRKSFCCYGCCIGGTVVTLVKSRFNLSMEDAVEIVHAFITNNVDSLSKEKLEILKLAFEHYDSPESDKYIEESKKKTEKFDQRIKKYIEKNNSTLDDVEYISKRLCCSKNYVKKFIPN